MNDYQLITHICHKGINQNIPISRSAKLSILKKATNIGACHLMRLSVGRGRLSIKFMEAERKAAQAEARLKIRQSIKKPVTEAANVDR
jgi:hypothetical protein